MDKHKKSLLCMYVDDFCGIKKESFNFCIKRRYMFSEGKISRKSGEEIKDFPEDFWGKNVSAVTLLIGENGAGKTTLMRLLIKWLCQLSAGNIPQEKGALVISDTDGNSIDNDGDGEHGNRDKLIAFDDEKLCKIAIDECNEISLFTDKKEIKEFLSDIRLAYYTDTMTDLELSEILTAEELGFLHDDSLLTRLSNSIKNEYTVDSIKDCIKRGEFARQMKLFLNMTSYSRENPDHELEFPIRYMKLTTAKAGDQKAFKKLAEDNNGLVKKAVDFWNEVFSNDANKKLPDIAKDLLWGLFTGAILSLLQWEATLPKLKESIVTERTGDSLVAHRSNNYYNRNWYAGFKSLLTNLFRDCKKAFDSVYHDDKFCAVWDEKVADNIKGFLDVLKQLENGDFLGKWRLSENSQEVWEFKLEYFEEGNKKEKEDGRGKKDEKGKEDEEEQPGLIENWINLWEHYSAVAHLMPGCRFDWKYASSGGKNQSNLYAILYSAFVKNSGCDKTQLWILLDEPDNTFHPDWKRGIIRNLLEICSYEKKDVNINFQLLISTHSPIMLSDVPKQAVILMKMREKKGKDNAAEDNITKDKQQEFPEYSPFGQQIYTLFNDAFFMERGIIGDFADRKIGEVYKGLCEMEEQLSNRKNSFDENKVNDFEQKLKKYGCIINLIEEPLLHGLLSQSFKLCKRRIQEQR